jgi:hypothetical protein
LEKQGVNLGVVKHELRKIEPQQVGIIIAREEEQKLEN